MSAIRRRTQTVQVTCVDKRHHDSDHEGITHLGGASWKLTREQVIREIEAGSWDFYTLENGDHAWLVVRRGPHGRYVQTIADGHYTNNLLALPECR